MPRTATHRTRLSYLAKSGFFSPSTALIANHLIDHGSISAAEAQTVYRSRSLSRRIADIRSFGVEVASEFKKDATGQRYVRYVLA